MNITFEEVFKLLPLEVKEQMTVLEFDLLTDNANAIMYELEMDGYRYGDHYDVESIIKDLLPDFVNDMGIVTASSLERGHIYLYQQTIYIIMNRQQLRQIISEEIQSLLKEEEVKVGDKLKHKLTGAEMVVTKVSGDELTMKYTSVGTQPGAKVGGINKTSAKLVGKSYDLI